MTAVKQTVEAMELVAPNSVAEFNFFRASLMGSIPEGSRSIKGVDTSIKTIYDNCHGCVRARHELAKSIYQFVELTGAKFGEVSAAIAKGMQNESEFDKSFISKLYHAGNALTHSEVASRIVDIGKLAELGKLKPDELSNSLKLVDGKAMLGDQYVSLIKRDDFKNAIATATGAVEPVARKAQFSLTQLRDALDKGVKGTTEDVELNNILIQAMGMVDFRIAKAKADKLQAKGDRKTTIRPGQVAELSN